MSPKTPTEKEYETEFETESESDPFDGSIRPLSDEPIVTEQAREGIKEGLIYSDPLTHTSLVSESQLSSVTLGLPIAVYSLRCDDAGVYAWDTGDYSQVYPVYVDGELDCLMEWTELFGLTCVYSNDVNRETYPDLYLVLFERLETGAAGSVALVMAKDGVYIYDGSSFELVSHDGRVDGGVARDGVEQLWHHAPLADANLPDELIAELRITDTSVTEPLV